MHPHAVVLDYDTLNPVLLCEIRQFVMVEILLAQLLYEYFRTCKGIRLQFYLPFFKEQNQGPLARVEVVSFQKFLNKSCLA